MLSCHHSTTWTATAWSTSQGGSAHVQLVHDFGRSVFDGELHKGQIFVVTQNFAYFKKAGSQGFEWIAVKTNDLAMRRPVAGRISVTGRCRGTCSLTSSASRESKPGAWRTTGRRSPFSPLHFREAEISLFLVCRLLHFLYATCRFSNSFLFLMLLA